MLGLPEESCYALELSQGLTDPEIFTLMRTYGISKGNDGWFDRESLSKKSLRMALAAEGRTVDEVVESLESKGFVRKGSGKRLRLRRQGETIEHCFREARAKASLYGEIPRTDNPLDHMNRLREIIREACEEWTS